MKRVRLIVMVGLVIAALAASVVPALAVPILDPTWNNSFQGDKNGDNIPDKWNVKGDVFRVCNHKYTPYTYDSCMMVFPPSSSGAALWQRISNDPVGWTVVTEEGSYEFLGDGLFGRKQLDWGRAYFGVRFYHPDGTQYVLYDEFPGGSEGFKYRQFYAQCGESWCVKLNNALIDGTITEASYGVLTLPGDGYLAVDWMRPD